MVQLLSASMTDVADYTQMADLLDHYYKIMIELSPDWVGDKYTFKMLKEDMGITTALVVIAGMVVLFSPIMSELPDDHALIDLISVWPKRMAATCQALDCLQMIKDLIE